MADNVYIFTKKSPYQGSLLGEIQTDFNMNFTIDGAKDSTKIIVRSLSGIEVEPMTILWHYNTNTWWCVDKDKVDRYENESGFIYVHTIQLNGAKELFNARDLTDCGFNSNRYTLRQFINRLIKLSKWEYPGYLINVVFGNNLEPAQYVSFVKTFENYTLLSALREFLDGYNCDFKLTFGVSGSVDSNFYLGQADITIIPKTGNVDLPTLNESNFKDVRETKVIEKNSFGTTVVSNAENVISSVPKTYPSQGSVRLSSSQYTITPSTAVLRLPSKVYKLNWLKIIFPLTLTIEHWQDDTNRVVYPHNPKSIDELKDLIIGIINSEYGNEATNVINSLNSSWNSIVTTLQLSSTTTLYEGNSLNPVTAQIVQGENVPYIPKIYYESGTAQTDGKIIVTDKDQRNCLPHKEQGVYWTRGSNLIEGFDFLAHGRVSRRIDTDDQGSGSTIISIPTSSHGTFKITFHRPEQQTTADMFQVLGVSGTSYIVNYIPMSDLKIKIDNTRDTNDIQLYNQNGKLTDSVALSKMLNSYSREISSDKITRFMEYYDFDNVPKAGQLVTYNSELYVINNVSLDFAMNENGYYISGEFTMCKYVSTKSLMVNPNTNIRDYGIPQNFNVKRKQLFRDYIEFSYVQESGATGSLYSSAIPLSFDISGHTPKTHTVAIECEYENQVDGSRFWDYQLETTIYKLEKMQIEVLDFNDNNIIGYGSQNTHSAFQVSRIFSGMLDTINTPISYVDENGEVKGLTLCWANAEQIATAWEEYKISEGYGSNTDYDLSNFSVFIPSFIVGALEQCDMIINEDEYYKDATEVPVFEHSFQVGDSDDVLIGDKILDNPEERRYCYMYGFNIKDPNTMNITNGIVNSPNVIKSQNYDLYTLQQAVKIEQFDDYIDITFYQDIQLNFLTVDHPYIYGSNYTGSLTKDIAIIRHKIGQLEERVLSKDVIMVLKNVPLTAISSNKIRLYKNKYKLR